VHSVSKHRCYVLEQYHEIDRRIENVNDLPKRSTEGERSLIKHFVRSLSMSHELLISVRNFFKHGQVGNWLGQANSVACWASWNSSFCRALQSRTYQRKNTHTLFHCVLVLSMVVLYKYKFIKAYMNSLVPVCPEVNVQVQQLYTLNDNLVHLHT